MATTIDSEVLTDNPTSTKQNGKLVQIKASGMMCSFCTMSVEKAMGRMEGVQNVQVNANVLLSASAWGAFVIGVVHLVAVWQGNATAAAAWPNFLPIAGLLMALHLFFGYFKLATRKTAADAVRKLLSLQAQNARVLRGGKEVEVSADQVSRLPLLGGGCHAI